VDTTDREAAIHQYLKVNTDWWRAYTGVNACARCASVS